VVDYRRQHHRNTPVEEYAEAEERVVNELKAIHKPFVVLLNSLNPTSSGVLQLSAELEKKYGVPVCPVNCLDMNEAEIRRILEKVLFEFPVAVASSCRAG